MTSVRILVTRIPIPSGAQYLFTFIISDFQFNHIRSQQILRRLYVTALSLTPAIPHHLTQQTSPHLQIIIWSINSPSNISKYGPSPSLLRPLQIFHSLSISQ